MPGLSAARRVGAVVDDLGAELVPHHDVARGVHARTALPARRAPRPCVGVLERVQVRAADAAGERLHQDLAGPGRGHRDVVDDELCSRMTAARTLTSYLERLDVDAGRSRPRERMFVRMWAEAGTRRAERSRRRSRTPWDARTRRGSGRWACRSPPDSAGRESPRAPSRSSGCRWCCTTVELGIDLGRDVHAPDLQRRRHLAGGCWRVTRADGSSCTRSG